MRLVLRLVGTWLIGLALVLLVMDGTRSLAADRLVFASLGETWRGLHADSLMAIRAFLDSRFFADLLEIALDTMLTYPAFAAIGGLGIVLALLGRQPRRQRFLRQDEM